MSNSKTDGPAATSFESPRKVGWLYKQGGSGVTSHWRKRWFVADHHYLFYYKKPDEKSPVGILCLPEYDSCHKTEGKEWKKPNTFLLDKGKDSTDSADGPSKSYVLHSDSEDDMLEWIKALKEEMKPMLGESLPNGRGQVTPTKPKGKSKSEADVTKVDPKAFNELSELAAETPKLTHLTASRPKVRNRRPPKKYAVFHEDDSKEDESPPPSPITKPLPTPPTPSPPSQPKKGHRPSAPILPTKPSKPLTPPTPPKDQRKDVSLSPAHEAGGQEASETKKAPPPPKKPSKERPLPPSKPSKTNIEPPGPVESETTPTAKKPRPQPPIKPRSSAPSITAIDKPTPPQPVPRPRPRKRTQVVPDTPSEETTPTVDEETTPHLTEEPSILQEDDESTAQEVPPEEGDTISKEATPTILDKATPTDANIPEESIAISEEPNEAKSVHETSEEATKEETKDETETAVGKPEESSPEVVTDSSERVKEETITEPESPSAETEGDKEVKKDSVTDKPTEEDGKDEKKSDSDSEDWYEDMDMGVGQPLENKEDSGSEYEEVEFEPVNITPSHVPQPVETSSKGQSTSSYVLMNPASPVDVDGGEEHDYDQPSDWGSNISGSPQGGGKIGEYDVPPPARPASALSSHSLDRSSPALITSSGSTGSRGQSSPIMPRKGSKGQSDRLNALRAEGAIDKTMERDRSPSGGSQGYSKHRSHSSTPSTDSTHSVSGTLRQAKEILRLAHMVKAEADEMKGEACRELELARRERHDAELLKKNAAQILKMAKERLSDSKPR